MPLYTADALVLRTYKLGEADRIVVFLTRDRGKKRGVAQSARRPRSRFAGRARAADRGAGGLLREGAARAGEPELRRTRAVADGHARIPRRSATARYFAELLDAERRRRRPRRAAVPARHRHARGADGRRAGRAAGPLLRVLAAAPAGRVSGRRRLRRVRRRLRRRPTARFSPPTATASCAGRATARTAPTTGTCRRARWPSCAPRGA